jgi:cytochrome c553
MKRGVARISAVAGIGLALTTAFGSPAARAGDTKAGAALAEKCQTCHGLDGLSKIPEAPNLAGQVETYLVEQLTAFKSGERRNEMMAIVAPDLSDKDIEDLAAYYSAIEITVGKTPTP